MSKVLIILFIAMFSFACISFSDSSTPSDSRTDNPSETASQATETEAPSFSAPDDGRPVGYNPDLRYDPNYVVNTSLTELSGYQIIVEERGNPFVMFYDKEKTYWNIATYNYERQFWFWHFDHFNPDEIDLEQIYIEIDLGKTLLNREKPEILSHQGYLDREKTPYDYSNDPVFADFMNYLQVNNFDESYKQYYLSAANNPAKRGNLLPQVFGRFYEETESGIQPLGLVTNSRYFQEIEQQSFQAGGMELLLRMHDYRMVNSFEFAGNRFRRYIYENKAIPLVVVEIFPSDGEHSGRMRDQVLYQDIEKVHEEKFGYDFDITNIQVSIDYKDFIGQPGVPGESTDHKMEDLFDRYIHNEFGTDVIYMYIFTDDVEYREIDDSPSHPASYGAYVTNWEVNKNTYFHELGHSLSLRHHFPSREFADKAESHNSSPCIMNYYGIMKSQDFCPLCLYSLGLDNPR